MPSFTSKEGSTPDSRSRIIQPSVRTVSLTQKGIKHTMKSSELGASLGELRDDPRDREREQQRQKAWRATDITAVRTNTCQ